MAKYVSKENLETLLSAVKTKLDSKITDPGNGEVGQILVKTDDGTEWATPEEVEQCMCIDLTEPELDEILKGMISTSVAYIDLGLPTGLMWATCNLGAESETDNGLYFQWGDTKGYKGPCSEAASDGNEDDHYFGWSKYKYCNGTGSTITKYCTDDRYGAIDNKKRLEVEDDAVIAMFGGRWRMPTKEEFQKLIIYTAPGDGANEYGWIENYNGTGVNGMLRKSRMNGNTIFFPASGFCDGYSRNFAAQYGYYWNSDLSFSDSGGSLNSRSNVLNVTSHGRREGCPIRAVLPTKETSEVPMYSTDTVDLGLPSGNLWATCNLGALIPEENGLYYQWGDTKGYKMSCNESESDGNEDAHYFDWSKYKYCDGSPYSPKFTKYCYNSSYGVLDNKTVLEAEDDAVTAALGDQWKMPTKDDFQELIDNTNPGDGTNGDGWIENYKGTRVNGFLLKSKTNGNTIFFPAYGYCSSYYSSGNGTSGHYWSSSLDTNPSIISYTGRYSYYLGFYNSSQGTPTVSSLNRCIGRQIRGIKPKN